MGRLATICSYLVLTKGELSFKSFQKTMYFMTSLGVPTGLLFNLDVNSPHSMRLTYNMDYLEMVGAIRVSLSKTEGYTIFPGTKAEMLVDEGKELVDKYRAKMDFILGALPEDPLELQLWATVHYVADVQKKIYGTSDEAEIAKEVMRVMNDKPGERRIIEVLNNMCGLGLIR